MTLVPRPLTAPILLVCALCLGSGAIASPAGFDALFERLDTGQQPIAGPKDAATALAHLRKELPPGDTGRARRYDVMRCALDFWHDSAGGLRFAEARLAEARARDDLPAQARFEFCRGAGLGATGQPGEIAAYEAGIEFARRAEDNRLVADGLSYRGLAYSHRGDEALALQDLLRAQALYERGHFDRLADSNLLAIGIAYRHMRDYTQALPYLQQSEAAARRAGDRANRFASFMQQGYVFEETGRAPAALRMFGNALALARGTDRLDEGYARLGLATALLAAGEASRALEAVTAARRDLAIDNTAANEPMLDYNAGRALAMLGRQKEALAHFDSAARLLQRQDNPRYMAMLLVARADTREALGDLTGALQDLRRYGGLAARLRIDTEGEQVTAWRLQFDASRRAMERASLQLDEARRRQQMRALERERPWRWAALALGATLLITLALLAVLQRRQAVQLRRLAMSDPLTGLPNRRHILAMAGRTARGLRASQEPFSVIALDLDHFKHVNDTYGHLVGDRVLAAAAATLGEAMREGDHIGRSGGEEFLVVLPGASLADAQAIAERLRTALEQLDLSPVQPGLRITTSAGVAQWREGDIAPARLIRRADAALYRAKAAGRNRVESDDGAFSPLRYTRVFTPPGSLS